MPPFQYPSQQPQASERTVYVRMLEFQVLANHGKLVPGDIIRVPESEAKRLVEFIEIAEPATHEEFQAYREQKAAEAETRIAELNRPRFNRRMLNANEVNANYAALANDPSKFDPSMLPEKKNIDPRLKRRAPGPGRIKRSNTRTLQDLSNEGASETQAPAKGKTTAETAAPGGVLPPDGDDGDD